MDQLVVIGDAQGEHVQFVASRREFGNTGDFDDDNWLVSEVNVRVTGFRGRYPATLRSDDFARLRETLMRLRNGSRSEAWEPLEPWVELMFAGIDDGFAVEGIATERVGYGNSLRFSFEVPTTSVAAAIAQIDALLAEFPIPEYGSRGSPQPHG